MTTFLIRASRIVRETCEISVEAPDQATLKENMKTLLGCVDGWDSEELAEQTVTLVQEDLEDPEFRWNETQNGWTDIWANE